MSKKNKKKDSKKAESVNFINKVASIIGIILVFLLIGLIIDYFTRKKKDKQFEEIQKRKVRLKEVSDKIERLKPIRTQIDNTQKKYFCIARIIIGILLLALNVFYIHYIDMKFTNVNLNNLIGAVVNFNGVILLSYSFFAFILFGNPNNLVNSIKKGTVRVLKQQHVLILNELECLESEYEQIENEIKELEITKKDEPNSRDNNKESLFSSIPN